MKLLRPGAECELVTIDYDADLADKLAKNEQLWAMLAEHAEAGAPFILDFFFYAFSKSASSCLLLKLQDAEYQTSSERRGSPFNRVWAVKGSTDPMTLTKPYLDQWTRSMVEIARSCEAQFDGWGAALPR